MFKEAKFWCSSCDVTFTARVVRYGSQYCPKCKDTENLEVDSTAWDDEDEIEEADTDEYKAVNEWIFDTPSNAPVFYKGRKK